MGATCALFGYRAYTQLRFFHSHNQSVSFRNDKFFRARGGAANAGVGIIILFKGGKNIKKALVVAGLQFLLAVLLGYLLLALGL